MPVPTELVGILERLFSVNIEPDRGSGCLSGGVGEDDPGRETPDGAFPVTLDCLEVALNMGPIPVRFLLLSNFVVLLIHALQMVRCNEITLTTRQDSL